jgi:hypothetical protein
VIAGGTLLLLILSQLTSLGAGLRGGNDSLVMVLLRDRFETED